MTPTHPTPAPAEQAQLQRERPILFSGPMVRAILEGRKTQTRRVVKLPSIIAASADDVETDDPPDEASDMTRLAWIADHEGGPGFYGWMRDYPEEGSVDVPCPYGQPGDRLWVRETWYKPPKPVPGREIVYHADDPLPMGKPGRWGSPIHMPRWACRLVLEVTDVRVQRLQELSAADAWAEGIPHSPDVNPVHEFEELWQSINAKRAPWSANPWVWAITFKRLDPALRGKGK